MQAIQGRKLYECSIDELETVFRNLFLRVGIRSNNIPSGEEGVFLAQHAVRFYGDHTDREIILAFDLALTDKLDLEHKDVVCYENFSCLYFSTIVNAYRRWKSKNIEPLMRAQPKRNEKQITMGKVHWGGEIETTYQQIKAGKFISYVTFPVEFYDQLCEDGFIEREPYLSAERKKKVVFELFTKAMEINKDALYARSDA